GTPPLKRGGNQSQPLWLWLDWPHFCVRSAPPEHSPMSLNLFDDDPMLDDDELAGALGYRNKMTILRHRKLGIAPPHVVIGRKPYTRLSAARAHVLATEAKPTH